MKRIGFGALAGLVVTAVLAPPVLAAPANVTVRVEGEAQTLLPRTSVRTTTTPPVQHPTAPNAPQNACPGTSAMGALARAFNGDVGGSWDAAFGFLLERIAGETQTAPSGADPARYWSFWVNYAAQNAGLCATEVQEGDDVLVFADCYSASQQCAGLSPLRLSGVPPTVAAGQRVTVKVEEFVVTHNPDFSTNTTPDPAENATVTASGQSVTTGADGTATLTLTQPGPVSIRVTKANRVRTAAVVLVTGGSEGDAGTTLPAGATLPAGTPLGTENPADRTAPVATLTGLPSGKVFARRRAPRVLRGTVTPDPSGLKSVRLSILRERQGRCWAFDGAGERFRPHRCGGSRSFRIGDRADWTYLLPERLPRGRYTIRVVAIDKLGNGSATETVIRVK